MSVGVPFWINEFKIRFSGQDLFQDRVICFVALGINGVTALSEYLLISSVNLSWVAPAGIQAGGRSVGILSHLPSPPYSPAMGFQLPICCPCLRLGAWTWEHYGLVPSGWVVGGAPGVARHLCSSVLTQEDPWGKREGARHSVAKKDHQVRCRKRDWRTQWKSCFLLFKREVLSFSFALGSPLLSKGTDVWNPWTCGSTPEGALDFGQEREERSSRSHPFPEGDSGAWRAAVSEQVPGVSGAWLWASTWLKNRSQGLGVGAAGSEASASASRAPELQMVEAGVYWKRCTTWELRVKFYLGQNEDCSPGDSTADSSERLLQRGSGGRSIHTILVKGEFLLSTHFTKGFLLVTRSCHHEEI